jgi:hypothetical protein
MTQKEKREEPCHGWQCPSCLFEIHGDEAAAVFQIFAPFMENNLAVFKQWREQRNKA